MLVLEICWTAYDSLVKTMKRLPLILSGILGTVSLCVLFGVAVFAPPCAPRIVLNQHWAVTTVREAISRERDYATSLPGKGWACDSRDFALPANAGVFAGRAVVSDVRAGYQFEIECPLRRNQEITNYTITAIPVEPGVSGKFAICSDQTGHIWYSQTGLRSVCLALRRDIEPAYE